MGLGLRNRLIDEVEFREDRVLGPGTVGGDRLLGVEAWRSLSDKLLPLFADKLYQQ
jgi:hypothetical protein